MKLLIQYLVKQNAIMLFFLILIGVSIYIIFNFVDNIGRLTSHGASLWNIVYFYILSIPYVVRLLFPLLFFLSIVIQLVLLKKNRELIALLSAGISPKHIVKVFLCYAIVCAVFSFAVTELSVVTENMAREHYKTHIRKQQKQTDYVYMLWIKDKTHIFYSKWFTIGSGRCEDVRVYHSTDNFKTIDAMYEAKEGMVTDDTLTLHNARKISYTEKYILTDTDVTIPFGISKKAIAVLYTDEMFLLGFKQIWQAITELYSMGVNTEHLWVELNTRIANIFYTMILAVLALWIGFTFTNPYVAVGCGVLFAVFFFLFKQLIMSLGNLHIVNPIYTSWYFILLWSIGLLVFFVYRQKRK